MKKLRVGVYTTDKFLFQKIFLDISENFDCVMLDGSKSPFCDIEICDADSLPAFKEGRITVGRSEGCDIARPFKLGTLNGILTQTERKEELELIESGRLALFKGRKIAFTDIEFALLSSLEKRKGGWVSRDELNFEVWGRESDGSLLNVYVHYLREKLEKNGEKVILSSRKFGYKIDEKYFSGVNRSDD